MNDEIREIVKQIECYRNEELCLIFLSRKESNALLDYIANLQQENEYLKKQNDEKTKIGVADHKYASQMEEKAILLQQENQILHENNQNMQEEMAKVWEENERLKEELFKSVNNTNKSIELTEDYKSRCEKINEILKESPDFNYSNDYIILKRKIEGILQGENNE